MRTALIFRACPSTPSMHTYLAFVKRKGAASVLVCALEPGERPALAATQGRRSIVHPIPGHYTACIAHSPDGISGEQTEDGLGAVGIASVQVLQELGDRVGRR